MNTLLVPRKDHDPETAQCIDIARKSIADVLGHLSLLDSLLKSCPYGRETSEEGERWLSVAMALSEGKINTTTILESMAKSAADDVFCVVSNIYDRHPSAKVGELREIAAMFRKHADSIEASAVA